MQHSIIQKLLAQSLLACFVVAGIAPLSAAVVHKWVDGNGITHYSDEAPTAKASSRLELPASSATPARASDYYSIKNQWRRVYQERITGEKFRQARSRQQATEVPAISIAYGEQPVVKRKVSGSSRSLKRRYHRIHRLKKFLPRHKKAPRRHYKASQRLKIFKHRYPGGPSTHQQKHRRDKSRKLDYLRRVN